MPRRAPHGLTFTALVCAGGLGACGGGGGSASGDVSGCDADVEYCGVIPASADACTDPRYWPLAVHSASRPLTVHYSRLGDADEAERIVAVLEHAWAVQVGELGFAPPLDDGGACGGDGRYDVFVWPGIDGAYVTSVADNPLTPHDDWSTLMAIDAHGSYGGALLETTLAHEFNHAVQASDDWWESPLVFEMSSTFAESLTFPARDDWLFTLEDFQERPGWSLFHDDSYRTWYMYGAAMFLHYLHQRHWPEDPGFISRIWRASRSDPASGHPDYLEAIRSVLLDERGVLLDTAVVEFMQWRWHVGEHDDGAHFAAGARWTFPVAHAEADALQATISVELDAAVYGAAYLQIVNGGGSERRFTVALPPAAAGTAWHLTTAGGEDASLDVRVAAGASTVLVATLLPEVPLSAAELDSGSQAATLVLTAW